MATVNIPEAHSTNENDSAADDGGVINLRILVPAFDPYARGK